MMCSMSGMLKETMVLMTMTTMLMKRFFVYVVGFGYFVVEWTPADDDYGYYGVCN